MPDYLTLENLKERLHLNEMDESGDPLPHLDDATITGLLDAAESYIGDPYNGILRRPVVVQSFTEVFDCLSDVQLRFPDGATVSSVTYIDASGSEQTLGGVYSLTEGKLTPNAGSSWPSHKAPVTVAYMAGFADVPENIVSAGYFYAGTLYEAQSNANMMNPELLRKLMCQMLAGYRRPTL